MMDEIHFQIEQERPHQSIATGDHNSREYKPYATSELRAMTILDEICVSMNQYFENENATEIDFGTGKAIQHMVGGKLVNKTFPRFEKFNVDRGALTGNQLHMLTRRSKASYHSHNIKMYCDMLMEDIYDDLVEAIRSEMIYMNRAFCKDHSRCSKKRAGCCTERQLEIHHGWKAYLEDIDTRLVGEYYDLAKKEKVDRPDDDGYAKKAHKLYLDDLRRQDRLQKAEGAGLIDAPLYVKNKRKKKKGTKKKKGRKKSRMAKPTERHAEL